MEDTKVRELWEAQVSGGGESHVEDTKVRGLWEVQVSGGGESHVEDTRVRGLLCLWQATRDSFYTFCPLKCRHHWYNC